MKNRRITLAAFLLVAVLVMGIGFAAVADNLNIGGSARANSSQTATVFDEKVYFDDAVKLAGTGTSGEADTIEITGTQKDDITFRVYSLSLIDQYTQFKITIKNESEQYDAVITLDDGQPTGTIDGKIKIEYSTKSDSIDSGEITCPSGGTVDVYVTVTLLCSPDAELDATFTCNLTATSAPKAVAP